MDAGGLVARRKELICLYRVGTRTALSKSGALQDKLVNVQ